MCSEMTESWPKSGIWTAKFFQQRISFVEREEPSFTSTYSCGDWSFSFWFIKEGKCRLLPAPPKVIKFCLFQTPSLMKAKPLILLTSSNC